MTWMNVKSLISRPDLGETVENRAQEVRGVAWTGKGHVTKVEFSTDRDPAWRVAELIGEPRPGELATVQDRLEAPRPGLVRPPRPGDRLGRGRPARDVAVEQKRLPVERLRSSRLRGFLRS